MDFITFERDPNSDSGPFNAHVTQYAPNFGQRSASRDLQPFDIILFGGANLSGSAERVPNAGMAVYAMSKAALVGMVRGLARDLGPRGVTINSVQPGPVETEINPANTDFAKMLIQVMSLPRYGAGDEIASPVAYLASPEAGYVTGASLNIDGGFTV